MEIKLFNNLHLLITTVFGLFLIVLHFSNLIIFIIVIFSFAYIQILMGSLGSVMIAYAFIMLKRNRQLLKSIINAKGYKWNIWKYFYQDNILIFYFIFLADNFFKGLFNAFVIINFPGNSLFVLHCFKR